MGVLKRDRNSQVAFEDWFRRHASLSQSVCLAASLFLGWPAVVAGGCLAYLVIRFLGRERFGVSQPDDLSISEASTLIDELKETAAGAS